MEAAVLQPEVVSYQRRAKCAKISGKSCKVHDEEVQTSLSQKHQAILIKMWTTAGTLLVALSATVASGSPHVDHRASRVQPTPEVRDNGSTKAFFVVRMRAEIRTHNFTACEVTIPSPSPSPSQQHSTSHHITAHHITATT
jgi:hypothetical protein